MTHCPLSHSIVGFLDLSRSVLFLSLSLSLSSKLIIKARLHLFHFLFLLPLPVPWRPSPPPHSSDKARMCAFQHLQNCALIPSFQSPHEMGREHILRSVDAIQLQCDQRHQEGARLGRGNEVRGAGVFGLGPGSRGGEDGGRSGGKGECGSGEQLQGVGGGGRRENAASQQYCAHTRSHTRTRRSMLTLHARSSSWLSFFLNMLSLPAGMSLQSMDG